MAFADVYYGVAATLAAHAQAQDDGRIDDLVDLYHASGVVEIPGFATFEGSDALRATFAGWAPTAPQRHVVTNTVLADWTANSAQTISDVVFVQQGGAGWAVQIVSRYHDTFELVDGRWLIRRRAMHVVT